MSKMPVAKTSSAVDQYGDYAGSMTRLVAFVIDGFIIIALIVVTSAVIGLLGDFLRVSETTHRLLQLFTALAAISIHAGYFILLWTLAGATVGKRIMGLVVVAKDGGTIRFGKALRRYVGYFISAILMLGYIWIIFDARRQGWHDKLAGTYVLYDWPDDVLLATVSEQDMAESRMDPRARRRLQRQVGTQVDQ
jgi:uncharacterized RDD family membrane protein YckC